MGGWQEEAVKTAVRNNDTAAALAAMERLNKSLIAAGQRTKTIRDIVG